MRNPNCVCTVCGKKTYIRPKRLLVNKMGPTCSLKCSGVLRVEFMKGEGNHQYGLTGHRNSSFSGETTISSLGYKLEYCPNHPRPHDKSVKGSRVKQHRLIIERNHKLFDSKYFENIDGFVVLKPEYDVHHINENRLDNSLTNLQILTRVEHMRLHIKQKKISRDSLGRITGVVKDCELLETPEDIDTTT